MLIWQTISNLQSHVDPMHAFGFCSEGFYEASEDMYVVVL